MKSNLLSKALITAALTGLVAGAASQAFAADKAKPAPAKTEGGEKSCGGDGACGENKCGAECKKDATKCKHDDHGHDKKDAKKPKGH